MGHLLLTNGNVLLDDGPPTQATVVIDGDRIVEVSRGQAPPRSDTDRVVDLAGRTLMPGMHICHFHACYFNAGIGGPYGLEIPPAYQAIVCYHNLDLALAAGFTGVVSAGGPNEVEAGVKQAIEAGLIQGPRFVPCSRELSTTGHANDSIPWYWEMPRLGGVHICDGADGFRVGVREEIKKGAEMIKLFVTGGHLLKLPRERMEMTRDELSAAIDAAHQRHVPIRGHIASKEGILLSVELGMDIIDHCDEMDDEAISALVENNTFVVPSLYYMPVRAAYVEAAQPELAASIRQELEENLERLAKAEAAGVRLVLGDDYSSRG
jgi:imidazolonepropionase-like amidohydrolase